MFVYIHLSLQVKHESEFVSMCDFFILVFNVCMMFFIHSNALFFPPIHPPEARTIKTRNAKPFVWKFEPCALGGRKKHHEVFFRESSRKRDLEPQKIWSIFFLKKIVDPPWKIMDSLNLSLKGDNYQLGFRLKCLLPRGTCRFLKFVMSRYAMAIPPKHEMPPWPFGRTCRIHKTQRSLTQKITWWNCFWHLVGAKKADIL